MLSAFVVLGSKATTSTAHCSGVSDAHPDCLALQVTCGASLARPVGSWAWLSQGAAAGRSITASESGSAAAEPWDPAGDARAGAPGSALLEAALAELQAQAAGLEVANARMRLELARARLPACCGVPRVRNRAGGARRHSAGATRGAPAGRARVRPELAGDHRLVHFAVKARRDCAYGRRCSHQRMVGA
jgi:hypothetical protein